MSRGLWCSIEVTVLSRLLPFPFPFFFFFLICAPPFLFMFSVTDVKHHLSCLFCPDNATFCECVKPPLLLLCCRWPSQQLWLPGFWGSLPHLATVTPACRHPHRYWQVLLCDCVSYSQPWPVKATTKIPWGACVFLSLCRWCWWRVCALGLLCNITLGCVFRLYLIFLF